MNERIKELALQAGMTDDKYGMFFAKDFDSHCADGVDLEKFAELIVKACADAADMAYDARCEYVGDYVAEYMGYGEQEGVASWRAK
jgi:hypothetical protein